MDLNISSELVNNKYVYIINHGCHINNLGDYAFLIRLYLKEMDKYNIGIRYGDFYARHLIESLDLQKQGGPVRVSMVHYNTIEEVEKLIQAFDKIF